MNLLENMQKNLFWKDKNAAVNKKEIKSHQDATECFKFIKNVRDHYHYTGIRFAVPYEIPVVFNNGSNYDLK